MNKKKITVLALFASALALFFIFDLGQYLNLEFIKAKQDIIQAYFHENPIKTGLYFFITYILITSVALPGGGIMTIISGALFGVVWGTILVSFGSVIGATIAFLISRYLFHDFVQEKFSRQLTPINRGIEKEGNFYLFTLRLIPVFPFFIINSLMALTRIKTFNFAWVSQIGMLLPTIVFVNAGTQLAKIESPGDILSPQIILSFVLLGLFPLLAKKTIAYVMKKRHSSIDLKEQENEVGQA